MLFEPLRLASVRTFCWVVLRVKAGERQIEKGERERERKQEKKQMEQRATDTEGSSPF